MIIKFISLNIWHSQELNAVASFLKQEDPDIAVLQEVYNSQDSGQRPQYRAFSELTERLEFPFCEHEAAYISVLPDGKIPEGNAILSKFPITQKSGTFFIGSFRSDYEDTVENAPAAPRALQHASVETPAGTIDIYNLHGPWDLDGDNYSEKRRQMSDAVISAIQGKQNVIVAGDTNATPGNQAIAEIEKHLTSVFGKELRTTFNMRRKDNPGYATAAVDMVFTSRNLNVISKSCPSVDISDHLPLIVTLELST